MRPLAATGSRTDFAPGFGFTLALLAALTLVRLIGLHFSVVDLYFDESQYWAWSRELSWGYFSKPPLLAWLIAAAERVCGAGEACIRALAPIFHLGTSLLIYAIAREIYDDRRVAFWAALIFALAPGLIFSARIISTDVPLVFFWALALLAYVKLLQRTDLRWAIVLGVALGLGLLAKYAMGYFLLGIALAALIDGQARALLRTPALWLALGIAALLFAPNAWWNLENGFATLRHVGDNIRGPGLGFSPLKAFEFILAQFAVFGPIAFATLVYALRQVRADAPHADRLMLAFALPVLALVIGTAFLSRAHANWAAAAYVSAAVLVAAVLVRLDARRLLEIGALIGVATQLVLLVADARADRLSLPFLPKPDVYERTMGWRALGEEAGRLAQRAGAPTIAGDSRQDVASMIYYARAIPARVLAWPQTSIPSHHFELTRPLGAQSGEPVLFVTRCANGERLAEFYASAEPLGHFDASAGPSTRRQYFVFLLKGAKRPIAPLAACR